jgi:AcrR family transcriptional regulator
MPKRESQKAETLVKTAQDLFLRYGIRRVSVEEICRKAGVSKMTFYKYFENKGEIAKRVLDRLSEKWSSSFGGVIHGSLPFEEKVRKIMAMKIQLSRELSKDLMAELLSGTGAELRAHMAARAEEHVRQLRAFLAKGQADGDIRADLNIDFLVAFLKKLRELYSEESVQAIYPDAAAFIKDAFTVFYYGALRKNGDNHAT